MEKAVKSFPPLFYYEVLEEHLFKFILVMVALQRSLLKNVGVKYFYHAVNQNIIYSLTTLPMGKDGNTYTGFQAISAAAQFLILSSVSNVETITLISFNYSIGSLWL